MTFFISPCGNDGWSGRLPSPNANGTDGPFATLDQARYAIRSLKASNRLPIGGVQVILDGGEYTLTDRFVLTDQDSGQPEAPIVYRAAGEQTVRISGGVRVNNWKPVEDTAILDRLPEVARGHVVQADLRASGIADYGVMASAVKWAQSHPGLEVFFRDQRMVLARYPNEGFLHIAELLVDDGHDVLGIRGSRVGRFRIDEHRDRLRRWKAEPQVMAHGYWFFDWADQRLAIAELDPDSGQITLDNDSAHDYGFRKGQWFYVFNLLCELDQPGEWYLDRHRGILYFWPPDSMQPDDVSVSIINNPIALENASHVTLEGFTVEAARGTAVSVSGGQGVRIAGLNIRNIGGDAVRVNGGRQHVVCDCDVYQMGDGGIYIHGGNRLTLERGMHEAVNNDVHHISQWNPLYKPGIQVTGCGNRVANNRLHDLPHIGIDFTGNDQTVEFNEIYRSVYGANDAGAIYTAAAQPEDWSMRGHRIRFNYVHHLAGFENRGCSGIYLDDMFSGTEIYGNILYRVPLGFLLGGGRDIVSTNNIFVDCARAIWLDARAVGWAAFSMPSVLAGLKTMPYRDELWASRYPELVDILDDEPALPKGNVIAHNIISGGEGIYVEGPAQPGLRMEKNLTTEDPVFIDKSRANFRLSEDSPAFQLGFEPIPMESIGLQTSLLRPQLPVRRLIETSLSVEALPAFRRGRTVRPGVLRVSACNLGDRSDSFVIRLRVSGGHLDHGSSVSGVLEPLATMDQRVALWADADKVVIDVIDDGHAVTPIRCSVAMVDDTITAWPSALAVSQLLPSAGRLEGLGRAPSRETLHWRCHTVDSSSNFCNLHEQLASVGSADALVWFGCQVHCPEAMQVAVLLGYDGPVKLFVDGTAIYHDPNGTNPASPDEASPQIDLKAGDHELRVALGANQGLAWGIFLRLQRLDVNSEYQPILPELRSIVSM